MFSNLELTNVEGIIYEYLNNFNIGNGIIKVCAFIYNFTIFIIRNTNLNVN